LIRANSRHALMKALVLEDAEPAKTVADKPSSPSS